MATTHIPFHNTLRLERDRFPAVTERSRIKALDRSAVSQDAEGFMEHYDVTLRNLHQGVDVADAPRVFLTAAQQAAEVEALAAYRIHRSCVHHQPCRCPECKQRRTDRAAQN